MADICGFHDMAHYEISKLSLAQFRLETFIGVQREWTVCIHYLSEFSGQILSEIIFVLSFSYHEERIP